MGDELTTLSGRELRVNASGTLNGNTLSVAAAIIDATQLKVLKDLIISPQFVSGNNLPAGKIKVTNDHYDPVTGIFWFDVRVNAIDYPETFLFETVGTVGSERFRMRIPVQVEGQSRAVVENIHFDHDILNFNVRATQGRIYRSPLATLATRNLGSLVTSKNIVADTCAYSWQTTLQNNNSEEFVAMGQVMIDQRIERFIVRIKPINNAAMNSSLTQIDRNRIKIEFDLINKPKGDVVINLPVMYGRWGEKFHGLANVISDLKVDGLHVSFVAPILEPQDAFQLVASFSFYESGRAFKEPTFALVGGRVNKWSDGQKTVNIDVVGHKVVDGVEIATFAFTWENGEPILGFDAVCAMDSKGSIKGNQLAIWRPAPVDVKKEIDLTIEGLITLKKYGIQEPIQYISTIKHGSDQFPIRVVGVEPTVFMERIAFYIALTQNNGQKFTTMNVTELKATAAFGGTIRSQSYDADTGILTISVDKGKLDYPTTAATLELEIVADGEEPIPVMVTTELKTPYEVQVGTPTWEWGQDNVGNTVLKACWNITGSGNSYPANVVVNQLTLNGRDVPNSKRYISAAGNLFIEIPVKLSHGAKVVIDGKISIPGYGSFLSLTRLQTTFKTLAAATLVDYTFKEVDGAAKLELIYDVQGYSKTPPGDVNINPATWYRQQGVKGTKPYYEYDYNTGKLKVVFDILDNNAPVYSAENTAKLNHSDYFIIDLKFSVSK